MSIFPDLSFLDRINPAKVFSTSKSTIVINGVKYEGRNININDNKIVVDGKIIQTDKLEVAITVDGDLETLDVGSANSVTITGNVTGDVKTMSAPVSIGGNVSGKVKTMSGNVKCGSISGNVSTMSGNIER